MKWHTRVAQPGSHDSTNRSTQPWSDTKPTAHLISPHSPPSSNPFSFSPTTTSHHHRKPTAMASEEDHAVYNEEDLDDEDDEESLDRPPTVLDEEEDDEDVEDDSTSSSNLAAIDPSLLPAPAAAMMPSSGGDVTIAVASVRSDRIQLNSKRHLDNNISAAAAAATTVSVVEEKKPSAAFDDSRKLFQRLWTDEDEIELLQGFLDYTTQRGATNSSHHHDTTAFYDQIKNKLQLEFNKNQLVEKLRRLKKKYRNVVSKIGAGKDYVFKSAHDQATFEISSKIWSNCGSAIRGGPVGPTAVVDDGGFEDEYANPNPNQIPNFIDHSPNLNCNSVDIKTPTPRSRKRSRAVAAVKMEEKQGLIQQNYQPSPGANIATPIANTNAATTPTITAITAMPIPSLIEETVKSCLSPVFKELLNNITQLNGGSRGLGSGFGLASSPIPLGLNGGALGAEIMADEKWRKQQILELEVYSRRLALVQDQIKAQLEELRSMGSS